MTEEIRILVDDIRKNRKISELLRTDFAGTDQSTFPLQYS